MNPNLDLSSISPGVWAILGVLAVVQIALDVVALVSLARRPRASVTFGNKWIWVAIILLVNMIGAILYLAIGRASAPPAELAPAAPPSSAARKSVADALYGEPETRDAP
ncbi:MAG: PLD nuclease N-terminal domain-containing protein [Pseudolysinimonas sp.]|uniref:PLD nuclease N-terminal domain-containing protein n=1 Tax=Pseudolysinimonas sp. TaxID=2680009 RepID=UPI003263EC01